MFSSLSSGLCSKEIIFRHWVLHPAAPNFISFYFFMTSTDSGALPDTFHYWLKKKKRLNQLQQQRGFIDICQNDGSRAGLRHGLHSLCWILVSFSVIIFILLSMFDFYSSWHRIPTMTIEFPKIKGKVFESHACLTITEWIPACEVRKHMAGNLENDLWKPGVFMIVLPKPTPWSSCSCEAAQALGSWAQHFHSNWQVPNIFPMQLTP